MKRSVVAFDDGPRQVLGSPAVKAGDYVFLGAQVAVDPETGLVPQVRREPDTGTPTIGSRLQSDYILDRSSRILQAAGSSLACGVRIDQFCTHPRAASPYLEARSRRIETASRPASTHVQIDSLLAPGALCGLQLIALTEKASGRKDVIVVPGMPASPGPPFKPAPHGIVGGDFIFVTGQIAHGFNEAGMAPEARLDPETWYGSPIKLQADVALKRCASVLNHVGASMSDAVRADVYLNDMARALRARGGVEEAFSHRSSRPQLFPHGPARREIMHCRGEYHRAEAGKRNEEGNDHGARCSRAQPSSSARRPRRRLPVRIGTFRNRFQGGAGVAGTRQSGGPLVWIERQEADCIHSRLHGVDLPGGRQHARQRRLDAESSAPGPRTCFRRWKCGRNAFRRIRPPRSLPA